MLEYFSSLCRFMDGQVSRDETWLAWLEAENSDFCRFNRGLIRQNGQVEKTQVQITLLCGNKRSVGTVTLSMVPDNDRKRVSILIKQLRETLVFVPEDPLYKWCEIQSNSSKAVVKTGGEGGFCGRAAVRDVVELVQGLDFVGCLMTGWIYRAFASSKGHHHWFESYTYCLDYSIYHQGDKAVHDQVSGHQWSREVFKERLDKVKSRVSLLNQPVKDIPTGSYRVYLAPAAIKALLWRIDFSARKYQEKNTWLAPLVEKKQSLSTKLSVDLVTEDGVVPGFQQQGYMRPAELSLIHKGKVNALITGPKTAEKYGIDFTGGEDKEVFDLVDPPDRLVMKSGSLSEQDICARVGDGLYISNLWYVNWSEKNTGCLTGMTRYACFEIKNGKLGQPINVMRFDDSLYHMLGDNLEELTRHRDTIMESFAFEQRSPGAHTLPGALVSQMTFTL